MLCLFSGHVLPESPVLFCRVTGFIKLIAILTVDFRNVSDLNLSFFQQPIKVLL
jgi:hypothetical protein